MQLPRPEAINILAAVAMFAIMAISTIGLMVIEVIMLIVLLVMFTAPRVVSYSPAIITAGTMILSDKIV